MTDAPERIWVAAWREGDWREGDWDDNEGKTLNDKPCIEYVRADRIEALTEQLAAARQDAKAAEDELEMQEQEACMMENDYLKLEKERDALEAKLAKAVELLEEIEVRLKPISGFFFDTFPRREIKAIVAEIKGESHE